MGNHCSSPRRKGKQNKRRGASNYSDGDKNSSVDHTSLRHAIVSAVPDVSIAKLYPVEDNFVMQPNGRKSPKSLAELATDSLCRSLPLLDGELPAGLPQDVTDDVVRSLVQHSALNATTLRILRQCSLAELSLAGCRGVTDQWLAPFAPPPQLYPSDDSMECDDEDNEEEEDDDEGFFSSMETTKNSSDQSTSSSETFLSAASPQPTANLTVLDLRGSQRLTDHGLMQLTAHLPRLQVAKLDNCHSLQGRGLVALTAARHHLHTLSLAQCRRLTDEGMLHVSHLVGLENLSLAGCRCLTDCALQALGDLYNLRKLDFSQCDLITDTGLQMLDNLEVLEELSLGWCRSLSDQGLAAVAAQPGRAEHLRILRLSRCHLTDEGLVHLGKLQALEELDLNGCHRLSSTATGRALAQLPRLEVLDVSYCPNILRAGWQGKIDKVRTLELCYAGVADGHLQHLEHLPALLELNLDSCPVGDTALAHLANHNVTPNLRALDLADTDLTDTGMTHIAKFQKLQRLSIFYCDVSNRGLRYLAQLPDLETLNLDSRDISDEGLRHLRKLTKLKNLDVFSGRITDVGCGHLSKIKSLETLELCGGSIGDQGCSYLGSLENLTSLNLSQNERISNRGAAALAALSKLKALNLSNTRVNGSALCYFSELCELQSLSLYGCPGMESGADLYKLRDSLPKLKCLRLNSASDLDGRINPTVVAACGDPFLDMPMEEDDAESMDVYSDHD